jgi:hydroxymethylpyrimidine pyrophosphatase-like HAD family hydrolase
MGFRVVAVDLDGTLLRSDKTVSARTRSALRRVTEAGARVVVVTARPPRFVHALAAAAGIDGVAVCANGAIVADLGTGSAEIVGPFPVEDARRAAAAIADVMPGVAFGIETGRRALLEPGYAQPSVDSDERCVLADLWSSTEDCVKLLAWSPAPVTDAMIAAVAARVPDVAVTYSGGSGLLEISAADVSKVGTLARLCDRWGVAAAEVIAFGDAPNDLSVLRWAGTAVAVANAHPAVLACADVVTGDNDSDGVAAVLEKEFVVPVG